MPDITFRTAWVKSDPELMRDAKLFWFNIGVLSADQIEGRARELCALAYADGQVAAVSTVHVLDFPRLRSRFFYYRTTVAPDLRRQRVAHPLRPRRIHSKHSRIALPRVSSFRRCMSPGPILRRPWSSPVFPIRGCFTLAAHVSTYPPLWTDHDLKEHYERIYPVALSAYTRNEPFHWRPGCGGAATTRRQERLLDETAVSESIAASPSHP